MKTVPTFCGKDCGGNACPLLLEIEAGQGTRILHNPTGGGHIKACRRGFDLLRVHYAEDRLSTPLMRIGPRGSTSFREANWDEALGTIAERLAEIRSQHGSSSILSLASGGCLGALHDTSTLTQRFLNLGGGCTTLSGSYSNGAAKAVLPFLFGSRWRESGCDAATIGAAQMIILWGANLLDTRLGSEMPDRLMEAKNRGAAIVVLDPRRTRTVADAGTWWIPCRPGSDAALMLALLHVLLAEGLVDQSLLRPTQRASTAWPDTFWVRMEGRLDPPSGPRGSAAYRRRRFAVSPVPTPPRVPQCSSLAIQSSGCREARSPTVSRWPSRSRPGISD